MRNRTNMHFEEFATIIRTSHSLQLFGRILPTSTCYTKLRRLFVHLCCCLHHFVFYLTQ